MMTSKLIVQVKSKYREYKCVQSSEYSGQKTGIHGPKPDQNQDHQKFETSNRTVPGPGIISKSRTGPGPTIFRKSRIDSVRLVPGPDEPWIPDYAIKAIDLP